MEITSVMILLNEVIYAGIFFSCFCRLCKTNTLVDPTVRFGFVAVATASMLCIAAPHVWNVQPTWVLLVIGLAFLALQWATAAKWRHGIPSHLMRDFKGFL